MTMPSGSGGAALAPVVTEAYLRESLGRNQTYPVPCHVGGYDGEIYDFHSHANNPLSLGGGRYQVASFTVTARPSGAAFGHPGFRVTCTSQANGTWQRTFGPAIPPQTRAALDQLATEIIEELTAENEQLKDEVAQAAKRKKDDDDRTNRKLRNLGLKV